MDQKSKWYHNVWFVLGMLLFVLGPFGLPLVWKNPRFSPRTKMILTWLMVGYTILLLTATIRMVQTVGASLNSLNSTLQY